MAGEGVYRGSDAPPEVDRSILVVGISGTVLGIDRATGRTVWRTDLPGWRGGAVFLAMRYGLVVVSSESDQLAALDYRTGATRWTARTGAAGRATIVIESDLIVCAKGGWLDAFDHEGRRFWTEELGLGAAVMSLGFPGNVVQADG